MGCSNRLGEVWIPLMSAVLLAEIHLSVLRVTLDIAAGARPSPNLQTLIIPSGSDSVAVYLHFTWIGFRSQARAFGNLLLA